MKTVGILREISQLSQTYGNHGWFIETLYQSKQEVQMEKKPILQEIQKKRGTIASIHREYTPFLAGVEAHFSFYEDVILKKDLPLTRSLREFLAVETSKVNECKYCVAHHQSALKNYQGPKLNQELETLFKDFIKVLSKSPFKAAPYKNKFIELGFSLEEYQHAVFVVSYFNFANRLAFAMDLELEESYEDCCR